MTLCFKEIHTRTALHVNKPPEQAGSAAVKKEEPAEAPPVNGASTAPATE